MTSTVPLGGKAHILQRADAAPFRIVGGWLLNCRGSAYRERTLHRFFFKTPFSKNRTAAMSKFRIEHDSMGELQVPIDALYGAQTQRAIDNFPISGLHLPREFIRALGLIKAAAADVNLSLGYLKKNQASAIGKPRWRWPMANTTHSFRSISSRPARAPAPT
jgi:hypothetical protein